MLVIGHRGAAGIAHENTMESLIAGFDSGADMIEFDVRVTKDDVPILFHNSSFSRRSKRSTAVKSLTLAEVRRRNKAHPIATLEEVLDVFFGKIMLNIEIKSKKTAKIIIELIENKYIKEPDDWNNILVTSFHVGELKVVRRLSKDVNIGLLHSENPFIFVAFARSLNLSAVGFHRLYINPLALEIAKRSGLFTYAYTVDRPQAAILLAESGLDGVVTDHPDRILKRLKHYTSHGD